MIVKCPQCQREYKVDERLLSPKGAMGRCKPCGIRFRIPPPGGTEEIVCPKCGFKQIGGLECQTCGVVFEKLRMETEGSATSGALASSSPEGAVRQEPEPATGQSSGPHGTAQPPQGNAGSGSDFVIGEAIRFGWDTAKANLGFFILLMLASGVILCVPQIFKAIGGRQSLILWLLITLFSIVLQAVITLGLTRISLKFVDDGKASFGDLFDCVPLFLDYLVAYFIYGLIVFAGLILLVVPGIIWAIQFMFYPLAIVDRGLPPVKALKFSSALTKGSKMDLLLLILLLFLINLLGALPLGLGLLITAPLSMVSCAYVYRKLQAREAPEAGA